ncbi:MAG: hypothetical protein P1U68_09285 [Verrucomicrobiales bacterium]|nr:hypothetical protein [Verrucomicrobiales bacterium]
MNNNSSQNSSRRKFLNKLAVGSLAGLAAGSVAHAADDKKKDLPVILQDPNVCAGLNTCKGKGKGEHDCAGQSQCATAEAHGCGGANACKGQGGCGSSAGQNECKGQGDCAVPLKEKAWKNARAAFEKAAKEHGIKVGPAPMKG